MQSPNAATPAPCGNRDGRQFDGAIVVGSHQSNSAKSIDLQQIRVAHLACRFADCEQLCRGQLVETIRTDLDWLWDRGTEAYVRGFADDPEAEFGFEIDNFRYVESSEASTLISRLRRGFADDPLMRAALFELCGGGR